MRVFTRIVIHIRGIHMYVCHKVYLRFDLRRAAEGRPKKIFLGGILEFFRDLTKWDSWILDFSNL
jgi:hypothetical protein